MKEDKKLNDAKGILNHALNTITKETGYVVSPQIQIVYAFSQATDEQVKLAEDYFKKVEDIKKEKKNEQK